MKRRWANEQEAVRYALDHGFERDFGTKIIRVKERAHIGLKVKGCADYLRDCGYIVVWG